MALESTVQLQQNDGNKTPEKPVDREKVCINFFHFFIIMLSLTILGFDINRYIDIVLHN